MRTEELGLEGHLITDVKLTAQPSLTVAELVADEFGMYRLASIELTLDSRRRVQIFGEYGQAILVEPEPGQPTQAVRPVRPKWRKMADRLAERLSHQADCPDHSPVAADPVNCPFCDDRAAYQEYLKAVETARRREHSL